jgi:hypothetical protein
MRSQYDFYRIKERRRNDNLRSKKHEHAMRRYEANLADQEQDRVERKERWALEKRERETRLLYSSRRELIEIGMSLVCLASAIVLLIDGIRTGQAITLGGSGAMSSFSVLWMHLSLGRKREAGVGVVRR